MTTRKAKAKAKAKAKGKARSNCKGMKQIPCGNDRKKGKCIATQVHC
jgi:hypothetical protein